MIICSVPGAFKEIKADHLIKKGQTPLCLLKNRALRLRQTRTRFSPYAPGVSFGSCDNFLCLCFSLVANAFRIRLGCDERIGAKMRRSAFFSSRFAFQSKPEGW